MRIEADGNLISIYMDGVLETTWTDTHTAYLGASNRCVGVMGHNGVFDDFEATNPSGTGGGGTTTTTTGTFTDDFNRANTTTGYGTDWSLHTPYSGGTVTTGRITSNQAVIDASWTMTVVDAATGTDTHYAQAVVDLDASNNWAGPGVRLNSTGNEGWAVLARGGVNELRLYRISNGLALKTAIGAGTAVDGATVKIEADATQVRVYLDGVLKITRNTTDFSDATHQHTGMMGHNGAVDDFETIGTTTTPPPPASTTMTQVHHRFNGQGVGSTIDGVFVLAVTDHLGSGSVSRQADGTTVTQSYTPFGALRAGGSNVLATDMAFTGQTDDPGTGLVDYNARAYDPLLGRFVMADTVLDGLNRYSYVNNNPLKFVDPSGHHDCQPFDQGCIDEWNNNNSARGSAAGGGSASSGAAATSGSSPNAGTPNALGWAEFALDGYTSGLEHNTYTKGNGIVSYVTRSGGPNGPKIGATTTGLRQAAYGPTMAAATSRAAAATSVSKGLGGIGLLISGVSNCSENSRPGRSNVAVVAETGVSAGGAWAGAFAGATVCAPGGWLAVGCGFAGALGADFIYDWASDLPTSDGPPIYTVAGLMGLAEETGAFVDTSEWEA